MSAFSKPIEVILNNNKIINNSISDFKPDIPLNVNPPINPSDPNNPQKHC